jgi:hypothetical protein
MVAFAALVQIACVASAALAIPFDRPRAIVAVALAVVASILFGARFLEPNAKAVSPSSAGARVLAGAAVLWAASLWGRLWILAYHRPPYDWDGLYYHIPAIHEWVARGHIEFLDGFPDLPFVNYPMAVEANTFLMYEAHRSSRLVDASNLWYWPMAFFAVVVVADRLGVRGAWPWLAGALLAGAPLLVGQSVSCYVDAGFAASVMAGIAASTLFVFPGREGASRLWLGVLWGASLGLVLGAKGTGVVLAPVVVLAVLGVVSVREAPRREALRAWGAGLVVALAVGGYWYVRNAYNTGNPLYPIQLKLGARVLRPGYDPSDLTRAQLPDWLAQVPAPLRVPFAWLQRDAPIQGYDPIGGLGYLWPVAELPAVIVLLALGLRRGSDPGRGRLFFVAGVCFLLLAVQPAPWWARFTLWLHVLGLPFLALGLARVSAGRTLSRRALALAVAGLVVALAVWESERALSLETARGRASGVEGTHESGYLSTLEMLFPGMAEAEGFDRLLNAAKIARSSWGRLGVLLGGALAMPLEKRQIEYLAEPTPEEIARLRSAGVRWVIWDVLGAGEVPRALRDLALEEHVYAREPDVHFCALWLGPE